MKLLILLILISIYTIRTSAQEGVAINKNNTNPDASALLDISSTEKGILIPRMTQTQRNAILAPATGLLIYQTNGTPPGFFYFDGSNWKALSADGDWIVSGNDMYNANSGMIGIGTSSPAFKMDLDHTNQIGLRVRSSFAGPSGIQVQRVGGDIIQLLANYSGFGAGLSSSGPLRFGVNGNGISSPSMYIETDGSVGIGTTTPSTKLDVVGVLELSGTAPADPGSNIVRLGDGGTNLQIQTNYGYVKIGPQNSTWSHFNTDRSRYYFDKPITVDQGLIGSYNENLSLQTSGTTRMTIDNSSGNVGIGITSPSEKLHVYGGSITIDDGVNHYTLPDSDGASGNIMTTDGAGNISWSVPSTGTDDQNISGSGLSGTTLTIGIEGGGSETVDLSSLQDDGDWTISGNDMYNANSGNIGIWNTSPGYNSGIDNYITIGDATPSVRESNSLELIGGSSSGWTGTGGAGVQNRIDFIASATNNVTGTTGRIEMTNTATNTMYGIMRFSTGNVNSGVVERLTIDQNGNVGIGTNAPTHNLDIYSTTATTARISTDADAVLRIEADLNNVGEQDNAEIHLEQDGGLVGGALEFEGSSGDKRTNSIANALMLGTKTSHDLQFYTTNSVRATIDQSGNMGIGHISPAEKLHVYGGSIRIDDGSNPYTFPVADGSAGHVISTNGSGVLSFVDPASITNKNTLDQAYDEGGAGAGRIITADAGTVEIIGTGGLLVDANTTSLSTALQIKNTNGTNSIDTKIGNVGVNGSNVTAYGVRSEVDFTSATSQFDGGYGLYGSVKHPSNGTIALNSTNGSVNKAIGVGGGIGSVSSYTGSAQDIIAAIHGGTGLHNAGNGSVSGGAKLYAGLFSGNGRTLGLWGENSTYMEFLPKWQVQDYDAAVIGFYNSDPDGGNNDADIGAGDNYLSIEANVTDNTQKHVVLQKRTTGNVGIGVSSPSQKLHVKGNMRLTEKFYDGNNSAGTNGQVLITTGSAVDWVDASTLGVTGDNLGNHTATANLSMDDFEVRNVKALQLKDWDDNTGGTNSKYRLLARDGAMQFYNGGVVVGNYNNGTWTDLADGTLIVERGLNVGGSSDPGTGRVEFSGTADATGTANSGVLEIANSLRFDGNEIITNTNAELLINHDNNGDVKFDNGTLKIDASENRIGIGTISPSTKLDVVGVLELSSVLPTDPGSDIVRLGDGGTSLHIQTNYGYTKIGPQNTSWAHFNTDRPRYYFDKGISVNQGLIGSYDENLSLQTSGTTRMTINNSTGNVGIGTTVPSEKLEVAGNIDLLDNAYIKWSGNTTTSIRGDYGGDLTLYGDDDILLDADDDIFFRINGSTKAVLNNTGQFAIGYTGGASCSGVYTTLAVNGQIGLNNVPVWNGTNDNDLTWSGCRITREGSSKRYKQNIKPLVDDFTKILQAQPKDYQMKKEYGPEGDWIFGYIAEELDEIGLKRLVLYDDQGRPDGIKYKMIGVYNLEIIKSQQKQIDALQIQLDEMKEMMEKLIEYKK
ncbi:MAG: tail fiber domain-containing protein [Saprospiraceae bacterium]|nr:tail fiber domain-containing protein [Saprospiraceae bacterium]